MNVHAPRLADDTATLAEARRIARDVAAPAAASVDQDARLPTEAIEALRAANLFGAMVPRALGGQGATIRTIAAACFELGQACASAAMVFAMHQIQVACLSHGPGHGNGQWHDALLRRVAAEGLLLASGTTEGTFGGDVRQSGCAMLQADGTATVEKQGCVISYAGAAGAYLVTSRATPDSPSSDQVLLVLDRTQTTLEQTGAWDTMGMRGTDSRNYRLTARFDPAQALPTPYAVISAETMLPVSHIVWAALWLGIATDACHRARAAIREKARRTAPQTTAQPSAKPGAQPSAQPGGARRLSDALATLQSARATLADAIRRYEAALAEPERLGAISFALAMNTLKLTASTSAIDIVGQAMQAIGLAGYRNDGPFSVARHLRDVHSSVLMIGNDRIAANNAALMTAYRGEEPLFP